MKILVYSPSGPEALRDALSERGVDEEIEVAHSIDEAKEKIGSADVLFAFRFPAELKPFARKLFWVQCLGAGVDGILEGGGLPEGVRLTRTIGPFGPEIAEYVFAEILYRERKVAVMREMQARREWRHLSTGTLRGKRMGIAGVGAIGGEIAGKALAFDMKVTGLTRSGRPLAGLEVVYTNDDWPEFVRDLDYLVLVLPHTADTHHLVGGSVFADMKETSVLVNVGRGPVVDEEALIEGLRRGRPGAAILDVFEEEPLPSTSPLWSMENVVVTSHLSGPTHAPDAADMFAKNLAHLRAGEPMEGEVPWGRGY